MNNREQWTKLFLVVLMLVGLLAVSLAATGNLKKMGKYKEATLVSSYGEMFVDAVVGNKNPTVKAKVMTASEMKADEVKVRKFYAEYERKRKLKEKLALELAAQEKIKISEAIEAKKEQGKVFVDKDGNVFKIVPMASVIKKEANASKIITTMKKQNIKKEVK